jgi:ABC-type amino acid transport substrate-binding protein
MIHHTTDSMWNTALRRGAAVLIPAVVAGALASCGSSDEPASTGRGDKARSALVVGSDLTSPPYTFLEGGQAAGFDPELVRALTATIDRKPTFKDTRFEQLIPGLTGGRIDLIASALYITAERAKVVEYIPYFTTGDSLIVPSDDDPVTSAAELCGKSAAVIKGAAVAEKLRGEATTDCRDAGKVRVDVREFASDPEAAQAVLAGQVDIYVTDAAVGKVAVQKSGGRLKVTSKELLYPIPVGLAVRKNDKELAGQVRKGLAAVQKSGAYAKLLAQYDLQPPDEAEVAKTLGQ